MYTEGFEQNAKFLKNFANPLNEWSKMSTDFCRRLAEQNLEIMGENFNRITEQTKRLSSIRKPEDIFTLQKDCLQEDLQASVSNMQKIMSLYLDNLEQWSKLCTKSTQETVSKTAESFQKTKEASSNRDNKIVK